MKAIEINNLEYIIGGNDTVSSFCAGFAAVAIVYGVGVLANWWNPVGWTGAVTAAAIGAVCVVNEL